MYNDMKYKILRIAYAMMTVLLFAACSQDETTDSNTLPEGKYPLQIGSVTMSVESSQQPWGAKASQTRMSENTTDGNSSVWDGEEVINVQINGKLSDGTTDYTSAGQYTVQVDADKKTTVTPKTGEAAYWHSKQAATVSAWHAFPLNTDGTVDLSDQKNALAYVVTAASANASFNQPVSLTFSHALAKVRVAFANESTADLANASVSILAPTSCTVDGGNVTAGATTDYIPMHKVTYGDKVYYEANVTSGITLGTKAFKLAVNGKTALCSTTAVTTQAGKCHEIALEVDNAPITLADNTPININDNGTYTINGISRYCNNTTITINGSPTVTLKDVGIKNNDGNCIHIKSGSPTIIVEGENWLQTDVMEEQAPVFHIGENANVTIKGTGKLTIQATNGNTPAIGAGSGETCGSITIQDCTITAYAKQATGIGSGDGNCGDITIKNATVDVTGGPAIGAGSYSGNNNCGDILIENTALTAKTAYFPGYLTATIGCGSMPLAYDVSCSKTCGKITITHGSKTITEILKTITGGTPLIGKIENSASMTSFCGTITITGSDGTQTHTDGVCNGVLK